MGETLSVGSPPVSIAVRRNVRSRQLTLRVAQTTGEVTLTAPPRVPMGELMRFAVSRLAWIEQKRAERPAPLALGPGGVLPILGQEVSLHPTTGRRIVRDAATLHVPGEGAAFRARLRAYLRERARLELVGACDRHAAALGRRYAGITLRDTRSRWGSCTSDGRLMFSWRLVMGPHEVLDYVAAHEIAHLAEMNHSPRFWSAVSRLMPDYHAPRDWLRRNGAALHRYQF